MRRITLLVVIGLTAALAAFALGQQPAQAQNGAITLPDALSKKLVTVVISGSGDVFFREAVGYQIINVSGGDLVIIIPAGLLLPSADDSLQTLVVGLPVTLTIKSKGAQTGKLWVFCTQLSKHAPGSGDKYGVGGMAAGNLGNAVQVIARHGWNGDLGAQLAVWRITDNATQEQLTGGQNSQASELISAIMPLIGLAGDPFTRAETILQEAGTGLHYSEFGTPVPAKSPLPGGTNLPDILSFFQRCTSCCTCFGAFGGLFFLVFMRR